MVKNGDRWNITWDRNYYELLGILAVKYQLIWGGDWRSIDDYPHLELPGI